MTQKFPYELRSILNATYIKVNLYPALIKVLGEEKVFELMKGFYQLDEERNYYNSSLTLLEYGADVINPLLNEKLGRTLDYNSWIELLIDCLEDRIGRDGGIRDERRKRGLSAWFKKGEPLIYDYDGAKYPYI